MNAKRHLVVLVLVVALAAPVAAHVPSVPPDNTAPDRAVEVPDATKSWSFYDRLSPGEVAYYRFSLDAGKRLQVGTFTPQSGTFAPSLVVMSPSLDRIDPVPDRVEVPEGMGAVGVEGTRPETPSYEPFAPSAIYHTADLARPVEAETTFVVAIYEPANRSGPVGLVVGYREVFSAVEYLRVPFDLLGVHTWEGQPLSVAVGPFVLTLLGGIALLVRRGRLHREHRLARSLVAGAGLAIAGSGVNTLVQMGLALVKTGPAAGALVTAAFVVVPLACGGWAVLRAGADDFTLTPRTRVGLAVAGVASLFAWAGFLVGPAVLLVAALVPGRLRR